MRKILASLFAMSMLILPYTLSAQENTPEQCYNMKILGTHTVVGTFIDYFEEGGGDITSTIYLKVNGKDFHINVFPEDVAKYFSNAAAD